MIDFLLAHSELRNSTPGARVLCWGGVFREDGTPIDGSDYTLVEGEDYSAPEAGGAERVAAQALLATGDAQGALEADIARLLNHHETHIAAVQAAAQADLVQSAIVPAGGDPVALEAGQLEQQAAADDAAIPPNDPNNADS